VKKSLQAVKGVKQASVDLEKKEAIVTYDDQQANTAALVKATTSAGFKSAVKK
jgi:mercuric ion binding protein